MKPTTFPRCHREDDESIPLPMLFPPFRSGGGLCELKWSNGHLVADPFGQKQSAPLPVEIDVDDDVVFPDPAAAIATPASPEMTEVDSSETPAMPNRETVAASMWASPHMSSAVATTPTADRKRKAVAPPGSIECAEGQSAERSKDHLISTPSVFCSFDVQNLPEKRHRHEMLQRCDTLGRSCFQSDKASLLDDTVSYMNSLQLQVQILSMARNMPSTAAARLGLGGFFPGLRQLVLPDPPAAGAVYPHSSSFLQPTNFHQPSPFMDPPPRDLASCAVPDLPQKHSQENDGRES